MGDQDYDNYLTPTFVNPSPQNQPQAQVTKQATKKQEESFNKSTLCCLWTVGLLFILALLISLILIAAYAVLGHNKSSSTASSLSGSGPDVKALSCNQLRMDGKKTSGLYYINKKTSRSMVYCDMTTDGGGWTLVASVNLQSPSDTCRSYSNFWSHRGSITGIGSANWINAVLTGSAIAATEDDYKGSAYVNLTASDLLVTHVPNFTPVRDYDRAAFFKYHTSNHFLDNYGSSLQTFFGQYAKLQSLTNVGAEVKPLGLIQSQGGLTSLVSAYYSYSYDGGSNYIRNGGKDMLPDSGNRVYYRINDEPFVLMNYGQTYTAVIQAADFKPYSPEPTPGAFAVGLGHVVYDDILTGRRSKIKSGDSKTYHISSAAIQPFVALASVSSFDGYPSKFEMKVVFGAATEKQRPSYRYINFNYKGMTVTGRGYFTRTSTERKTMICPILFEIKRQGYGKRANYQKLESTNLEVVASVASPDNILVGYTLLAGSTNASYQSIPSSEIMAVLRRIVDLTISASVDVRDLNPKDDFVIPVNFVKGKLTYPGSNVTPGYLQLRAYDFYGAPYAMCPGVRVNKADPAMYCIGSSYNTVATSRCGDFAGWSTLRDHVFVNRSTSANFVNDMSSTIMIFTRNHKEKAV